MSMTLKQIRYFVAAAEAGQVSLAASLLNVSQSAMTLAIQDLEAGLGVKLFTRRSTGLELTRDGRSFLTHATGIQTQVARAVSSVRNREDPLVGTVRVGVTDTLSSYFLMPKLALIRREHPGLDIHLREAERPRLEDMLIHDQIDIALLLTSNIEARDELDFETFHKSPRRLWVEAGHPLLDRPDVSIHDLTAFPYVLLRTDEAERQARAIWSAFDVEFNVVFETVSIEAVRSMVAQGLAVTILSDVVFRTWTLDGLRVAKRDLIELLPSMDVGLAWHKGRRISRAMRVISEAFTS